MMLRDLRFGAEPDDGENLRQIGRSLSGTVVTSRRSRLTATRSLVSGNFFSPSSAASLWLCSETTSHVTHCFPLCSSSLLFVPFLPFVLLFVLSLSPLRLCASPPPLSLFLSKVKQSDVSASPCLLPLF